jgi:type II secretory ATPase GspE/PulE/Tfp pilus assembly ATPase PilB-like protein
MGIKPFLVATSIQAIMAQRVIRLLCSECKAVDEEPDPDSLRLCGLTEEMIGDHKLYKPMGCSHCNNTGYRGRKGIFELLELNNELRELAFNRAGIAEIRRAAKASGMANLLNDGQRKILKGVTSVEEITRIAQAEVSTEEGA